MGPITGFYDCARSLRTVYLPCDLGPGLESANGIDSRRKLDIKEGRAAKKCEPKILENLPRTNERGIFTFLPR